MYQEGRRSYRSGHTLVFAHLSRLRRACVAHMECCGADRPVCRHPRQAGGRGVAHLWTLVPTAPLHSIARALLPG